tara:strand:- start:87 stop:188 length:102 start_codon:yes stop_codon:yes gene_type:complete
MTLKNIFIFSFALLKLGIDNNKNIEIIEVNLKE